MSNEQSFEVEFPEGYFGQWEEDTPVRGCLDVKVHSSDGRTYLLAFYDLSRLKHSLDTWAARGAVHYADPNLVVLVEVNTANVRKAVADLAAEGYFEAIKQESTSR